MRKGIVNPHGRGAALHRLVSKNERFYSSKRLARKINTLSGESPVNKKTFS